MFFIHVLLISDIFLFTLFVYVSDIVEKHMVRNMRSRKLRSAM